MLLGIAPGDSHREIDWLAEKIANLRAFADDAGKMNRSVQDVNGSVLVVSQFTLYGNVRRAGGRALSGPRRRRSPSRFTRHSSSR